MLKKHPLRLVLAAGLALTTFGTAGLRADAPANDAFANAADLGSGPTASAAAGSTLDEATIEAGEPFLRFYQYDENLVEFYGATAWWSWTCPAGVPRLVTVNTVGSEEDGFDPVTFDPVRIPLDTLLMVFTGDALDSLTAVAESDDRLEDATSQLSFIATPGTTYRIRIDSRNAHPMLSAVNLALTSMGAPVTAAEHLAWGQARLTYTGNWNAAIRDRVIPLLPAQALTEAAFHFQEALKLDKTNAEANLFLALISLVKLQKEPAFAALLAQVGLQDGSPDPENPSYYIPEDIDGNPAFAAGALSTAGLEYLKTTARPRLLGTLATLEKITSTTMLVRVPDHLQLLGGGAYLDQGDVLMLRGGCKALLGLLDLLESFNFVAPLQNLADLQAAGRLNVQNVADGLQGLLSLSASDQRKNLKTNLQAAITLYNQASTYIRGKRLAARDGSHLFPLLENLPGETQLRTDLGKISKLLGGATVVHGEWSFNISKVLAGTLSLRDVAPNFKGNQVIKGSVPAALISNVLPGSNAQKIHDFLETEERLYDGLLNLSAGILPGQETFGSIGGAPGEYLTGSQANFTATPVDGYLFGGWTFNGTTVSILSPFTFPVLREYSLLAVFSQDNRDDDKDGLTNYQEIIVHLSNPKDPDTDDDGWPDGLDGAPTVADPRVFTVSQDFSTVPLGLSAGQITAISGLPPGVTFNAKTQKLAGRPNALTGTLSSKPFVLRATVKPTTGASYTLTLNLTLHALPEPMVGTFHGLIPQYDGNPSNFSGGLGGTVSLTVTTSGVVSGKFVVAGKSGSFAGARLDYSPGAPQGKASGIRFKMPAPLPPFEVNLRVESSGGTASGEVNNTATNLGADFYLQRSFWSSTVKCPHASTYNAALLPDPLKAGDLAYPQGAGYAVVKITPAGAATWTGKLADGTLLTGGAAVSNTGMIALHTMLYTGTGSIQGGFSIVNNLIVVDGSLYWTKNAQAASSISRSYKSGFPERLAVAIDGSVYVPPPALPAMLGLTSQSPATNNAQLAFEHGNLDAAFEQLFTVASPAKITMPGTVALNPRAVKLTFTHATGLFSGSFTYDTPPRKADFSGAFIRHLNRGVAAFQLPQKPVGAESPAKTPILSGDATLSAAP